MLPKETATRIHALTVKIGKVLRNNTMASPPDANGCDQADTVILRCGEEMDIQYALEEIAELVKKAAETPAEREARETREEADDLRDEQDSAYYSGLGDLRFPV